MSRNLRADSLLYVLVDGVQISAAPDWLRIDEVSGTTRVFVDGPRQISTLTLVWGGEHADFELVLGDAWERGYGDLRWSPFDDLRVLPWLVVLHGPGGLLGYGVKTRPGALVEWSLSRDEARVTFDLRSGRRPLALGSRELLAGELVVLDSLTDESAFAFVGRFCQALCDSPRIPASPIYGANDWYYAYGESTAEGILADTARTARWAGEHANRPFSVIDAGWQTHGGCEGGPWVGNERFGDMGKLASRIKGAGCRPGIWIRPLLTQEDVPSNWLMRAQTLDPSQPEALSKAMDGVRQCADWGYELIKHDFTTWDCTHLWGFEMGSVRHAEGGDFADDTRTSAEIYLGLYDAIREAAGDAILLGCNTWGHLAAGTHEIQRTGDDTSGKEWARTLKMGVNTLAFRSPQHGRFFAADADCVGITTAIPWELNRQWMDAVARSGTPLFISADQKALTPEIESALVEAFSLAADPLPLAEPLDWMERGSPNQWRQADQVRTYSWALTTLNGTVEAPSAP